MSELIAGQVYPLKISGLNFGQCLYIGERSGKDITYRHQIVRREEGEVVSTVFSTFYLRGNELNLRKKRGHKLSDAERKHLEERLEEVEL